VVAYVPRGAKETRGIGIEELAESMRVGLPHRASGTLALHVLEAAEAAAAAGGRAVDLKIPRMIQESAGAADLRSGKVTTP
jgi:hypothetical protein